MNLFLPFDITTNEDENINKIVIDDLIFSNQKDFTIYENIWTYNDTENLNKFIKEKYEYYMNEVIKEINNYNDTCYSSEAGEVLLGDSVLLYMTSLFFKKVVLLRLKDKYENLNILLTNNKFIPIEVTDVFNNYESIDFHSSQYEELANFFNINILKSTTNSVILKEKTRKSIKNILYTKVIENLFKHNIIKNLIFAHKINNNTLFNMLFIPFKTFLRTFYMPKNELIDLNINDNIDRVKRDEIFNNYKNTDIVLAIILKNLPIASVEGLNKRKESVLNILGKTKDINIYTGVGSYTSSFIKYACFFNEKAKLNIIQHGGLYGMAKNHHLGYINEKRISVNFFQWGNYNNNNTILSSYQINRNYNYNKKDKKKISFLFVLSSGHKQYSSVNYYSSPLRKLNLELMLDVYLFINKQYDNTYLRTLNHCNEHNYIKNNNYNIKLDRNRYFFDSLRITSIMITDHFGTTYLEALSSNIPVLVILNESYQSVLYTEEFTEIMIKMKINNLLFDTIKEFKDYFINKEQIINNWYTNDVESLKQELCNKYARKDANYLSSMLNIITNKKIK